MTGPSWNCGNCRFARPSMSQADKIQCHRRAPQMLGINADGVSFWCWPFVNPNDWCGEHDRVLPHERGDSAVAS